jgi:mRNA-degrading endonuclease RelE of RelBE toxin-antitoxin system
LSYQVELRESVKTFYEKLAPAERRAIKQALKRLGKEQGDIRSLRDRLEGYYRLRVGTYRIILRYLDGRRIECVYMNARSVVYEIFESEMRRILTEGHRRL